MVESYCIDPIIQFREHLADRLDRSFGGGFPSYRARRHVRRDLLLGVEK
jgi:hypothetical protein